MQCSLSILTQVSIRDTAVKSPRTDFSRKGMQQSSRRGEGKRISILTRFGKEKQRLNSDSITASSGMLEIISRQSSPGAIHSEVRKRVCVSVYVRMRACVMGFVPLCCISTPGFLSFQIAFVTLDGLFDAQQEGCVPLVKA